MGSPIPILSHTIGCPHNFQLHFKREPIHNTTHIITPIHSSSSSGGNTSSNNTVIKSFVSRTCTAVRILPYSAHSPSWRTIEIMLFLRATDGGGIYGRLVR